jgi:hypothetical protein
MALSDAKKEIGDVPQFREETKLGYVPNFPPSLVFW